MISEKDVIKILMPFPDINSDLALIKHYYICHSNVQNNKVLFKCQTHKATMIAKCGGNKKFREHYYLIRAGNQVPFVRNTVVDKKQIFALNDTMIPKKYLSPEKPSNIPGQIYADVVKEIITDSNPTIRTINKEKFLELNTECQ